MTKSIKTALIGCGYWGKNYLRLLEKNDFFSFIDTLPVSVVVFPEANFEITLSVEVDFSDNLDIKPRFFVDGFIIIWTSIYNAQVNIAPQ